MRKRGSRKQRFADRVFRMNWFENGPQGQRVFTVNVVEAADVTGVDGVPKLVDYSPVAVVKSQGRVSEAEHLVREDQNS